MSKMLSKITQTMKEKKVTQRELCKRLGLKETNFGQWKRGKTESYKKYLPEIAKILDVTVDYLITEENEQTEANEIVRLYNQAPEWIQHAVMVLLKQSKDI